MANDLPNGHTYSMAPSDYSVFMIGGQEVRVPILTFLDLERIEEPWNTIDGTKGWIFNARVYLKMVAILIGRSENELALACRSNEALGLGTSFNDLLIKSGIMSPEPQATAENPGTGTSTLSSPTSQSEESAEAIQSE